MAGPLRYRDHRQDPAAWARELGIPRAAVELYLDSEAIDLHVCSFLWTRLLPGWDLARRHRPFLPRSAFLHQADLPRVREAALGGVVFDIPTNPFRTAACRAAAARRELAVLARTLGRWPRDYRLVRSLTEYRAARAAGLTAAWLAVQGGQAFDADIDFLGRLPDGFLHRVTLVHLTTSRLGAPNAQPFRRGRGLTARGVEFIQALEARRILVDLAHINRRGFFQALAVCTTGIPPIVSHTGLSAVKPLWRNIDDDQVRAIAERGGTVGIIYNPNYLGSLRDDETCVLSHLEHAIRVGGEEAVSLGSDYDGLVPLPRGFIDITHQPKLVAAMLRRGWTQTRVRRVLGENYLRVWGSIRP